MPEELCIVLCTVPDTATGEILGRQLVEAGLAACVNLIPGLTSIYRWQGRLQQDAEVLMLIKTRHDRFGALSAALRQAHPYELPEIIAVPLSAGLPAYLDWLNQTLDPNP
jgi:periplasmic divalent cation tolerance protein